MWCTFGDVTLEHSSQRNPRSPPCGPGFSLLAASERRGNNLKRFNDLYLQVQNLALTVLCVLYSPDSGLIPQSSCIKCSATGQYGFGVGPRAFKSSEFHIAETNAISLSSSSRATVELMNRGQVVEASPSILSMLRGVPAQTSRTTPHSGLQNAFLNK